MGFGIGVVPGEALGLPLSALLSPISHVIRWSDKLTMGRKPQNFNDVNSKFEGVARELRATLKWGTGASQGCRASSELLAVIRDFGR